MRDLFSGYDYVHMYVHMFWSHLGMLIYDDTRNVNLPLRSGTRVSLICALHKEVNGQWSWADNVSWWWRMGRTAQHEPLQCTYLVKPNEETSAEHREGENKTILSLAHVSDTPSYCKIRILSTGAYIRNQQPGWVLIFEGAYFHGDRWGANKWMW